MFAKLWLLAKYMHILQDANHYVPMQLSNAA